MSFKIEVLGLGAGEIDQLPLGVYKKLTKTTSTIYVRTIDHPVVQSLKENGMSFESFDHYYEEEEQFKDVYKRITQTLIECAKEKPVLYAVPGHPMLAEQTVQYLIEQDEVEIDIIGGHSYLDDLFTALKIDPIEGFQFIDATAFERKHLNYEQHIVFCQVYDRFVASDVKLTLLEDLPPHYEVTIVEAAGTSEENITVVPLNELDYALEVNNLRSIYIPPPPKEWLNHTFSRLREVIAILRGPNGCEWDKQQTHETLRPYLIEEAYEVIDAIDRKDDEGIVEELGDLLLQVMLHSQIGEDSGYFLIDDVIKSITEKMIRRHPHVFGDVQVESVADINKNWEAVKREEKGEERTSVLDGIPKRLPTLSKAYHIQKKAAQVGFDWDHVEAIWEKVEEELQEVKDAIDSDDSSELEKEIGDSLFALVNLARYYEIDPELALNQTNQKFMSRFKYIEEQLASKQKTFKESSLEEMDDYWEKAKRKE